jgi:glutamate-1-semialdehyde aminotransferase
MGGGLSIGAILGQRKYLDALDGGHWQYGDESIPEIGVTYFAGTFVRHPLA